MGDQVVFKFITGSCADIDIGIHCRCNRFTDFYRNSIAYRKENLLSGIDGIQPEVSRPEVKALDRLSAYAVCQMMCFADAVKSLSLFNFYLDHVFAGNHR